jgi:hypothetical protein
MSDTRQFLFIERRKSKNGIYTLNRSFPFNPRFKFLHVDMFDNTNIIIKIKYHISFSLAILTTASPFLPYFYKYGLDYILKALRPHFHLVSEPGVSPPTTRERNPWLRIIQSRMLTKATRTLGFPRNLKVSRTNL